MDYTGLVNTSINQIADKGRLVDLVYKTQGTYNAATDAAPVNTTSTQSVRMVILDYNKKDVDGTLILASDRRALLAPDSLTRAPTTDDAVSDGGVSYNIQNVEEIKPGDTVLLYKLQLRK